MRRLYEALKIARRLLVYWGFKATGQSTGGGGRGKVVDGGQEVHYNITNKQNTTIHASGSWPEDDDDQFLLVLKQIHESINFY